MIYIAEMPSYTYAVKARRLLSGHGIPCHMSRRVSGCGYDLRFSSHEAVYVLDKYNIPYELKNSGGERR